MFFFNIVVDVFNCYQLLVHKRLEKKNSFQLVNYVDYPSSLPFSIFSLQMILQQMELITSTDVVRNLCKKMAPPLVTLLSAEPEIQYVALRNINLIVQRRPTILAHEIKVNSTLYVLMHL